MKIVICTIQVIAMHFFSYADVTGKVLTENKIKYLVDFSADAHKRNFEGNYSKKLVNKSDCVVNE